MRVSLLLVCVTLAMVMSSLAPLVSGSSEAKAVVPSHITLVVPFAAGGPTDKVARAFVEAAQRLDPTLTFTLQNVGGAGGTLGAAQVASGSTNGSQLLLQNIAFAVAPSLYPDLPYRSLKDFAFLGLMEEVPMTLVGRSTLPPTFAGLKQWLHDNAATATIAHAGLGSASNLCGLLFQRAINQTITERVYTGNAPAVVDVSAGKVDLICDTANSAAAYLPQGLVRAYGVTSASRVNVDALRNVSTFAELGLNDMEITVWFGLAGPKHIPSCVKEYLNKLVRNVLKDATFLQSQESTGAAVVKDKRVKPCEHKKFVAGEIDYWADVLTPQ